MNIAIKIKNSVSARDGYRIVAFNMVSYNSFEYEIGRMNSGFYQEIRFNLKNDVFEKVDNTLRPVRFDIANRFIESCINAIERQKDLHELLKDVERD